MSQNLNYEFSDDDFKLAHGKNDKLVVLPMPKMFGRISRKIKVLW